MSKLDNQPTTGERLDKTYETLMTVLSLAATIEAACETAEDRGAESKCLIGSIGTSVRLLEKLAGDAAEEVELCEEYRKLPRC